MEYSATTILLAFFLLSIALAIPVKLSTKIISAQNDSFGACFLAVALALASQLIVFFVVPNVFLLVGVSLLVNGAIFSAQLGVPFVRGLMIAIFSIAIALFVSTYFGLLEVEIDF